MLPYKNNVLAVVEFFRFTPNLQADMKKHMIIRYFHLFIIALSSTALADDACLVPDNAVIPNEIIEHQLPPDYSAGVIWFQAVTHSNQHDESLDGEATIIIDQEEVIETCPASVPRTIFYRDYTLSNGTLSEDYGGLYLRDPWFGHQDYHTPITDTSIQGGNLTITVSKRPERVYHWWTDRFPVSPSCTYSVKIRFKIVGEASFQIGSDWWREMNTGWNKYDPTCQESNNCEAWASDWFSDTQGKFFRITVPLSERCNTLRPEPPVSPIILMLQTYD